MNAILFDFGNIWSLLPRPLRGRNSSKVLTRNRPSPLHAELAPTLYQHL